jgi:hypothetical protein
MTRGNVGSRSKLTTKEAVPLRRIEEDGQYADIRIPMRGMRDASREIGDGEEAGNCLSEMCEREADHSDFGV